MALPNPITASQTDAESPLDQTLFDAIRLDLNDLDSRVVAETLAASDSINTHFFATGLDTNAFATGGDAPIFTMGTDGNHFMVVQSPAAAYGVVAAATNKFHLRLNKDLACFMEFKNWEEAPSNAPSNVAFGLQDASLALSASTCISDVSDFIGFIKGTTANQWKFRTAKAAAATETDNIGARGGTGGPGALKKLRLELTKSGATLQVKAYFDGSEISGSPFTTNIPDTVVLRPLFGLIKNIDNVNEYMDYLECKFTAITLL